MQQRCGVAQLQSAWQRPLLAPQRASMSRSSSLAAAAAAAASWRSSGAGAAAGGGTTTSSSSSSSTSTSSSSSSSSGLAQLAVPHFLPAPVNFYPGGGAAAPPPAWHPRLWGVEPASPRDSALRAAVVDWFAALSDGQLPAALPVLAADGVTFFSDEPGAELLGDGGDAFGLEAVAEAVAQLAPRRYALEDVLVDAERGTAVAHYTAHYAGGGGAGAAAAGAAAGAAGQAASPAAVAGGACRGGGTSSRGTGTFRFDRLGRITSVQSLRQCDAGEQPLC